MCIRDRYLSQVSARARVEIRTRLVEHQDVRPHAEDGGRGHPLPLAEGEVVCGPLSETAHPDGLEGFVGPMRDLLGAQPQVRRAEGVAFGPSNLGLGPEEVAHRTHEALESVGMGGFGERAAHHLSFGQRKRVATATVLSMRPDILAVSYTHLRAHETVLD